MQRFDLVSRLRLDISWERLIALPTNIIDVVASAEMYGTVWVPQMNRNGGINDKFALGTRSAMRTYLNRVRLFDDLNFSLIQRRTGDLKRSPAKWACGASAERKCSALEPCCWVVPVSDGSGHLPNCSLSKKSTCGLLNLNSERFLELAMWLAQNITVVHRQDWTFCKFGDGGHSWTGCTSRMRMGARCQSLLCVAWTAGGCRCQNTTCSRGYNPYCVDTSSTQLRLDGVAWASHMNGSERLYIPVRRQTLSSPERSRTRLALDAGA